MWPLERTAPLKPLGPPPSAISSDYPEYLQAQSATSPVLPRPGSLILVDHPLHAPDRDATALRASRAAVHELQDASAHLRGATSASSVATSLNPLRSRSPTSRHHEPDDYSTRHASALSSASAVFHAKRGIFSSHAVTLLQHRHMVPGMHAQHRLTSLEETLRGVSRATPRASSAASSFRNGTPVAHNACSDSPVALDASNEGLESHSPRAATPVFKQRQTPHVDTMHAPPPVAPHVEAHATNLKFYGLPRAPQSESGVFDHNLTRVALRTETGETGAELRIARPDTSVGARSTSTLIAAATVRGDVELLHVPEPPRGYGVEVVARPRSSSRGVRSERDVALAEYSRSRRLSVTAHGHSGVQPDLNRSDQRASSSTRSVRSAVELKSSREGHRSGPALSLKSSSEALDVARDIDAFEARLRLFSGEGVSRYTYASPRSEVRSATRRET